ncbi:MAG TPA: O-antigen ligase family protein [Candidatus Kapabacteria bacterium]|jgi:O-antigen ligase
MPSRRAWFLLGIVIIPLVYSSAIIDPAFTPRAILLSVLTLITIVATRNEPVRTSPLLWIWAAYAACNVASIFVAQNSGEAIYYSSIVLLYGAWLFAVMQVKVKNIVSNVSRGIATLALLLSMIGLLQFFDLGFGFIPGGEEPYGTMLTKNLLSSFLFLTVPATFYCAIIERREWRMVGIAALLLTVFSILISQTRAVWLGGALFGIVFSLVFLLSKRRNELWDRYRVAFRVPALGIAACVVAVFVFNVAPRTGSKAVSAISKAETLTHYSSDTSSQMRLTVWKESIEMHRDHPLIGVGAGNWKIQLPHYGLGDFNDYIQNGSIQWTETHNDFLNALCETGIPGGLAYVALFIAAIFLLLRSLRNASKPEERFLSISIVAMLCGFMVISFFDFPKSRVEHSMLLMLWFGFVPARAAKAKTSFVWALPFILTIPALVLSFQRFSAETQEREVLQARADNDWQKEIAECNKIYNAKLLSLDALATPILYYKAEGEFMQTNYDASLRDNLKALKAFPNHFYTMNNIGSDYVKLGDDRTGESFYRKALAISPNFEESLLNLTAIYFNRHQYDSARMSLTRCDTSQPNSRAAQYAAALRKIRQ